MRVRRGGEIRDLGMEEIVFPGYMTFDQLFRSISLLKEILTELL